MIIGLLKEIKPNEYRVAATPAAIGQIVARGHKVLVQAGAGIGSGFADSEYAAAGATVLETAEEVYTQADLFYKVKEMFPQEWKYMNENKIVYTYIHSNAHPEETDAILESKVTAIAYEDITDDNGQFPLLKPMSILAGKGGFLAALHHSQSVFGGNGTLILMGEEMEMEYDDDYIWPVDEEDEKVAYTFKNGKFTMEQDGMTLVFKK